MGSLNLEDNMINVLPKEIEEEPIAHRRLLHHQLHTLWLDPDQHGDPDANCVDDDHQHHTHKSTQSRFSMKDLR